MLKNILLFIFFQGAGADGVKTILEKLLLEVKFELLPSSPEAVEAVEVTEDFVLGKAPPAIYYRGGGGGGGNSSRGKFGITLWSAYIDTLGPAKNRQYMRTVNIFGPIYAVNGPFVLLETVITSRVSIYPGVDISGPRCTNVLLSVLTLLILFLLLLLLLMLMVVFYR